MNNYVHLGRCQKAAILSSLVLIALAMGVVSLDSASSGAIGLKVQKAEMIYGALWLILLGSIVCSWPTASSAFAELRHSAQSITNGLTYEKIVAFGVAAYPNYQEKAGHFHYSHLPKTGFLRLEASIIVGTKPNGTAELGVYSVRIWRLWPELIAAYLRATFVEGRGLIFCPYITAIAAVLTSQVTGWSGSPYELFRMIYA